ncbi:MAG: hypothetical protein HC888_01710 [Candidatus Competibacteraceae bacterium]|nr:hypothetical protein [Candidatus Competibacteraceae bacterium]
MLYKDSQLADYLLQLIPGLKLFPSKPSINPIAAETLYDIWDDEKNHISDHILKKPTTVAADRVDLMKQEGLVKQNGNVLEVTDKGKNIIKTMILGNDSSIFDEKKISLAEAEARIKQASVRRKNTKTAQVESSWWSRFE